jgi:hypothetical protein
VNIPLIVAGSLALKRLAAATTADLDQRDPVIVYCWDYL